MDLLEHQGKRLLAAAGIAVPDGAVAAGPDAAAVAARTVGAPVMVKAQVPSGRRGKAGAVLPAATPDAARDAAARLLGTAVGGTTVTEVLVERRAAITAELYAAVLNDPATKGPLVLCSASGGMDVEETGTLSRCAVDIRDGLTAEAAAGLAVRAGLDGPAADQVAGVLVALYRAYRANDAELVEVNPLALTPDGPLALDAKITIDPGALARHPDLAALRAPAGTELERAATELGLVYLELDGAVGVLANGAGLTMQTLDAIGYAGARAANFCEVGGDAYTKATPALRIVLGNPRVRSLLVKFCGAFARTDVMTAGVVAALEELKPAVPVFFTIHGTGEAEAVRLVRERLGAEPYDDMGDAVAAAVAAARAEVA